MLRPGRASAARVLTAALVVAAADLLDAVVVWVVIFQRSTVQRILQSIASGLLGPAAFGGGSATAALGLALHLAIALGWTVVFFILLVRWPRLREWTRPTGGAVLAGLVYGAAVWLVMDGLVLPLSRAKVVPPTVPWFWIQLATHPLVVGLPIALILARCSGEVPAVAPAELQQATRGNR